MGYTFLPAFARGTGLSVEAMGQALSARELTSLSAPFAGRVSDRVGALRVMAYAGLLASVGLLVATLGATGLVVGFVIFGVGRTAYQVSMGSWIADAVAYERRGRATGRIELAWGGAALIGLPIVGFMLGRMPWWTVFLALGVTSVLAGVAVASGIGEPIRADREATRKPNMTRAAVSAIATNAMMNAAAQFLFLSHGLWLEDTYGLDTAEVGFAIIAVGAIEVVATTGSSRLTDRLGKRVSMLGGTTLMTLAMFTLAFASAPPLALGLLVLVVAFLGFEFGIVSSLPLLSELDPEARAQMIGRSVSVGTVIRALVTLIATKLYVSQGFDTVMLVAAGAGAIACALAAFVMVEPQGASSDNSLSAG